ncbi:hypothetical protein PoB_005537100 [Plakobranchus ocellatus]|uniref:Uncharacterized protein n=1 Tax=Plakobranchus ocellatus TaxID=259542 RepID=A0AAV4C832_9GAST|nr:hypothetical protein PoB_005537100 [Plakobranchus ocellatus]
MARRSPHIAKNHIMHRYNVLTSLSFKHTSKARQVQWNNGRQPALAQDEVSQESALQIDHWQALITFCVLTVTVAEAPVAKCSSNSSSSSSNSNSNSNKNSNNSNSSSSSSSSSNNDNDNINDSNKNNSDHNNNNENDINNNNLTNLVNNRQPCT